MWYKTEYKSSQGSDEQPSEWYSVERSVDCESLSVGQVSAFAGICIYKDSQDLIMQFLGYGREAIGREEIFFTHFDFY